MNVVVTGIGPRCGTSAMMRLLINNGWDPHSVAEQFPHYVAREKNPEGFWDVSKTYLETPTPITLGVNQCIKLWHPYFSYIDWTTVDLMVILHRQDFIKQFKSTDKCAKAEGYHMTIQQYSEILTAVHKNIKEISSLVKQLRIPMRYLRGSPNSVLTKIKEAV